MTVSGEYDILTHKWEQLGLALDPDDFTDGEAMAAIARITGGNSIHPG